jgi:hypothetical protein
MSPSGAGDDGDGSSPDSQSSSPRSKYQGLPHTLGLATLRLPATQGCFGAEGCSGELGGGGPMLRVVGRLGVGFFFFLARLERPVLRGILAHRPPPSTGPRVDRQDGAAPRRQIPAQSAPGVPHCHAEQGKTAGAEAFCAEHESAPPAHSHATQPGQSRRWSQPRSWARQ